MGNEGLEVTIDTKTKNESIPERVKRLFWDVNKDTVDMKKHRPHVIRRIMDHGDIQDVKWMLKAYSSEEIVRVLKKSRGLSRKSAYFWAAYFNVPRVEVECLKMPYQKRLRPF